MRLSLLSLLVCAGCWTAWVADGQTTRRARSLAEWIYGMRLDIPLYYSTVFWILFVPVEVEVDRMECVELALRTIRAEYRSPRTLFLDLEGLDADCEGPF